MLESQTGSPAAPPSKPIIVEVTADNGDGTCDLIAASDGDDALQTWTNIKPVSDSDTFAVGDRGTLAWMADGEPRVNFGGGGAVPITVSLPAQEMDAGDYVDLANFTLPTGKQIYITHAYIANYAGTGNANYDLECYNVTDSASIYETSSATLQVGTLASPLGSGAEADQIVIRAENNSAGTVFLCALMTFVVK